MKTAHHPPARRRILPLLTPVILTIAQQFAQAETYTWTGASNTTFSNSGNWTTGGPPGSADTARFSSSGTYPASGSSIGGITTPGTYGAIQFDGAPTFKIGTNTNPFTLNGATINDVEGIALSRTAGTTGEQTINNNIKLNAPTLTFDIRGTSGRVTLLGAVADGTSASSLIKTGNGELHFSGASTFTGSLQIQQGSIRIDTFSKLGGAGAITLGGASTQGVIQYKGGTASFARSLIINSGGGRLDNSATSGTVTLASSATVSGEGQLTLSGARNYTVNALLTQAGGFRKIDSGNTTLNNTSNTFGGTVIVQNGELLIPSLSVLGNSTGQIALGNNTNQGKFTYTGTGDINLNHGFLLQGSGGGWFEVQNTNTTATLDASSTISGTGRFQFGGSGKIIVDAQIATADPDSRVIKSGSGTAWLTNSNSYLAGTTVRNGTLIVSSAQALGSSPDITLADSGSSGSASPTFLTDGSFTVTQNIIVNSNNTTGVTTIGAGTQSDSSTFSGNVTLGRSLQLTSSATGGAAVTFSGSFDDGAGSFGLKKIGDGKAVLSGTSNTYDGGTDVAEGTLEVAALSSLGTGDVSVASGALLQLDGNTAIADTALLTLAAGAPNGLVNLNFAADTPEVVFALNLDGTLYTSGLFNASTHPEYFSGTGSIVVPEPASLSALMATGLVTLVRRRRAAR